MIEIVAYLLALVMDIDLEFDIEYWDESQDFEKDDDFEIFEYFEVDIESLEVDGIAEYSKDKDAEGMENVDAVVDYVENMANDVSYQHVNLTVEHDLNLVEHDIYFEIKKIVKQGVQHFVNFGLESVDVDKIDLIF